MAPETLAFSNQVYNKGSREDRAKHVDDDHKLVVQILPKKKLVVQTVKNLNGLVAE